MCSAPTKVAHAACARGPFASTAHPTPAKSASVGRHREQWMQRKRLVWRERSERRHTGAMTDDAIGRDVARRRWQSVNRERRATRPWHAPTSAFVRADRATAKPARRIAAVIDVAHSALSNHRKCFRRFRRFFPHAPRIQMFGDVRAATLHTRRTIICVIRLVRQAPEEHVAASLPSRLAWPPRDSAPVR